MSNGYGYKTAVSPVNTGSYGYGGYGGYGTQMPMTLPAQQGNQAFPLQAMGNQTMPLQAMGNQAMPLQAMGNQAMPMHGMGNQPMTGQSQMPPTGVPSGSIVTPSGGNIVSPFVEESYVENILRLNRGKAATFYMTYENNSQWNAKIFKGIIEAAGRDHIIISDPTTGMRFLLLTLNLDYVTFDEPIAYEYPFQGTVVSSATPLGR
ncbi:spore coat protein GerQ [Paenibacillus harenae]|uniref:spore coat protein GerQ n=1 Tax=Paenibacillus harenae TaxID=306543 RepID=UPI00278F0905|nr:spore coat protein GerQ [Paenibacillus harenae]MDQ0060694.1 spore germination protein Q [Paenibacillus harenae]